MPLTPDYGGPVVSYADGVFDTRFNRFVTVREGMVSISIASSCAISFLLQGIYVSNQFLIFV